MRVGHARVELPVPAGTDMGGYAMRDGASTGVLDPLGVSAVTWSDGRCRAALVLADVVCVNDDVTRAVRSTLRSAVRGVDLVWVAASHTHAGPETGCVPGGAATPSRWLEALCAAAVRATGSAVSRERESAGIVHSGQLRGVGAVRSRVGSEPVVPLDVVEIGADGLLVVLPVHPTVLPPENRSVSADLTGAVRRALEERLRPGRWVAVATGAAGDISTRHTRQGSDPAELERLGALVADRCLDLLAGPGRPAWTRGSRVAWATRTVPLPPRTTPGAAASVDTAARAVVAARRDGDPVAVRIAVGNLNGARLAARLPPPSRDLDAEVGALRLGDLAVAALPGEPFLALAEVIRDRRDAPTLVLGYANGYPGYLPTRAAYAAGGYEVLVAAGAPGGGERLADTATALIADLDRSQGMVDQDTYADVAQRAIDRLRTSQRDAIARGGRILADALLAGGVLQTYGTGHSRAVALEVVGRAGGLLPANQLAIRDLVYYGDTPARDTLDPLLERRPELAARIWDLADIRPEDAFLIVSNSGGNGALVEMARLANERGHPVVAITSLAHTGAIISRHPSGERLVDVADVVIDNCAPYGDAALTLPGGDAIGALSNLTGILAANMLVAEIAGRYLAAGEPPPVFRSANTPGGFDHNMARLAPYGGRVRLGDA